MKILLAVDGSENAVRATGELVENLARYKQTPEVELVTVRQPLPHVGPFAGAVIGQDTIEGYYREEGEKALAPSKQVLEAAGIRYSPHVLVGEIAQTIIAHAQKSGCEMIYMGTRGMTPISSTLLGSIAIKVLHLTPVPVVLVP
jgi:nucleotide-binding universal stress UspA family protein